ncbi:MerR family transcriptional regulator [Streptomyces sp. TRM68416]|uniref:MerR family transcriptional regulator n=1 Tax=Streptomyces sp. TRM68416 TaxID=2758412 RepID=UPI0016618FFB|nr:MerR family transcriptional regulator [Streptomyces sp. TRM68416]MBD0839737.1 B12-binding domain-containing protein [Streptomyces sp. TRM68416]
MTATEEDPVPVGVTTGFLARRLGVSPTTLRSWDRRYGLGPAARVQGRHRRWTAEDVAMVQEMCRLTAAGVPPAEAARAARQRAADRSRTGPGPTEPEFPSADGERPPVRRKPPAAAQPFAGTRSHSPSGLPLGDVRRECRGLARAAVRMDSAAVQEQVSEAVAAHGLITAWETVLAPTLRAVGRKWESSGDRYVEVEHLLSWHISAALRHAFVDALPRPGTLDAPPVLLACLPGEQHTLPLEALAAALAERGLPVLVLGAAVPPEALLAAVRRTGPGVVLLWSQSRATADTALAHHAADVRWGVPGARTRPRVLLGGPGWGLRAVQDLPRPRDLREAVDMTLAAERGTPLEQGPTRRS